MNKPATAFIAFLLALLATAPLSARETRHYFTDWLAACRDDGYCSATAYDNPNPPQGYVADYVLRVGRADQGVYWEISIATVATMPGEFPEFDVRVDDGQPITFGAPFDVQAYGSINDFFFQNDPAQNLFDAMGPGREIAVGFTDDTGTDQTAHFSLDGLNAALLWIDDVQHRLGSERVTGPAPLGLTPVRQGNGRNVPAGLLQKFRQDQDCDGFEALPNAGDIIQFQTRDGSVYFLPCFAGAYNFGYKAFYAANGYDQPLLWADYSDALGWTGTPFIVNPDYDPDSGILTSFYKGRGIGDCGNLGTWKWTGSAFRLIEYAYKGECDAKGGPDTFPIIYKAETPQKKR